MKKSPVQELADELSRCAAITDSLERWKALRETFPGRQMLDSAMKAERLRTALGLHQQGMRPTEIAKVMGIRADQVSRAIGDHRDSISVIKSETEDQT